MSTLEHVNITVEDSKATAKMLCELFDWDIRWQGDGLGGLGYSVHVGDKESYVAVYSANHSKGTTRPQSNNKSEIGNLNHIGILVEDIAVTEAKVKSAGYVPYNHGNYEPGRRFYFDDENGVEIEVVSYTS